MCVQQFQGKRIWAMNGCASRSQGWGGEVVRGKLVGASGDLCLHIGLC